MKRALLLAAMAGLATISAEVSAADLQRGELLFQTCSACHSVLGDGLGPDLHGIFGQKAAQIAGFKYSDVLKASGLTWDEKTLRAFIADPQALVKGTLMAFPGYKAEADLDALIAYIKTLQ
jgi:cytochrome c